MAPSALGPRLKAAANITLLECSDIRTSRDGSIKGSRTAQGRRKPQRRSSAISSRLNNCTTSHLARKYVSVNIAKGAKMRFRNGIGSTVSAWERASRTIATCDTRRALSQQSVCARGLGAHTGSARNNSAHWMSTMSAAAKTPRAYGSLIRPSTSGARILNPVKVRACKRMRLVATGLEWTSKMHTHRAAVRRDGPWLGLCGADKVDLRGSVRDGLCRRAGRRLQRAGHHRTAGRVRRWLCARMSGSTYDRYQ